MCTGIPVFVDNVDTLPTVAIVSPANGATLSGTVVLSAQATDDRGVAKVEFFVEGESSPIGSDSPNAGVWSLSWSTNLWSD